VNDFLNGSAWNQPFNKTKLPSVDIHENQDGFNVEMAVPGYDKTDFKIELENNQLTISSEKKAEQEMKEDQQFTRKEYSCQSFSRSFLLPDAADSDKIEAKYDNGILTVSVPKKEEARPKPAKQIAVA
jgi:HSP20 family protein